jgi:sec-independent protein translocase protein TatA
VKEIVMPTPVIANLLESPIGLLVILIIALLFFGHKLPSVARSLGSSVSEFKKGVKEGEEEEAREASAKSKKAEEAPAETKK